LYNDKKGHRKDADCRNQIRPIVGNKSKKIDTFIRGGHYLPICRKKNGQGWAATYS